MPSIGAGAAEIRISDQGGAFRVVYVAKFADAIYVLHCFQKKVHKTSQSDIDLAKQRYRIDLTMTRERFESVWDALEDSPADAANMRLRAALMRAIQKYVRDHKLTQGDVAALFDVTQPRVSDLMRGKIDLFSVDTLVNMAAAAKLTVDVRVREPA